MNESSIQSVIDKLNLQKKRRDNLINRQFKVTAELDALRKSLRVLNKEAEEAHGTSNLDDLESLLEKETKNNLLMVENNEKHLDNIEEELVKIETPMKGLSA